MFAHFSRLLVLSFAVTCILSACGPMVEYEYCEGKGECCSIIDTRYLNVAKHFCTSDPKDCVAENSHQIVKYPSKPGGDYCEAREKHSSLNYRHSARLSSHPLSPAILDRVETFFASSIVQVSSNNTTLDCRYICEMSSPLCSEFPATLGYRAQMDKFAKLFDVETAVIPKSDVMTIFNQKVDQCNRSDLFIENGRFENSGETHTCIASSTKNIGSEKQPHLVHMEFILPKQITGNVQVAENRVAVRFDPGFEPIFVFDNNPQSLYSLWRFEIAFGVSRSQYHRV